MINSGEISRDELCWRKGMTDWQLISDFYPLAVAIAATCRRSRAGARKRLRLYRYPQFCGAIPGSLKKRTKRWATRPQKIAELFNRARETEITSEEVDPRD